MDEERTVLTEIENEASAVEQLLKEEQKQSRLIRILMIANVILAVGMLIALLIIVPKVTTMVSDAEKALANVEDLSQQAKTALNDLQGLAEQAEESLDGIDEVVENANGILVENASGMNEAIDNFNSMDFEKLNQAINDLSDAVAPLASFARMFGN